MTPPFVYPVRIGDADGALLTGSLALLLGPGLTASYDPNVVCTGDGASITGAVRVELAGGAPPPTLIDPVTYTDATPHTLATIPIAAGTVVAIEVRILANLGVGNTNAARPGLWVATVAAWRVGSANAIAGITDASLASNFKPFLPVNTTSAPGLLGIVVSGGSVLLQANGFAVSEAWTSGHTYTAGDGTTTAGQFATANGNVYLCTTSGTASGSAPSGTGTGLGTGAKFDYVCAGSTVPVQFSGLYSATPPG
jgi:hypothetical protein